MTKFTNRQLLTQEIVSRNLGRLLKDLRESYGLTQYQVATGTGVHQTRISAAEVGKYQPMLSSLVEHIMGIGVARTRKEICNDECLCKQYAKNHTAEEIPDSTRHLLGQAEIGQEVLRPGNGDLERIHDA